MNGYVASIAFSTDGNSIGVSCPRGGLVHIYDATTGTLAAVHNANDIGGIAAGPSGFVITSGLGDTFEIGNRAFTPLAQHSIQWDNHLIAL